jgi:hypothetical protein
MTRRTATVSLFAKDRAHEAFVRALVRRLAAEDEEFSIDARVHIGVAQGGHGRVISELELYQRARSDRPTDILAVIIDANCAGWNKTRADVGAKVDASQAVTVVIGCPDPHIERWFLADPDLLSRTFGLTVSRERRKCNKDF